MLVLHAGHICRFEIFGVGKLRALRGEECVLIVKMVQQKAGGEDVAAGEIGLDLGEIVETEDLVVVGLGGQGGVDKIVIFAVERIVEPRFAFDDRAGEREEGKELVKAPSMLVLKGRN